MQQVNIQYYYSPCGEIILASVDDELCLCDWNEMPCAERNKLRLLRYMKDRTHDPISLTMPFREEPYLSDYLFPVFTNMLPEGANRKIVCRSWRLDEKDFFGLLLKIATYDTIGAITVKEVES